jgi:predicted acyl esterase
MKIKFTALLLSFLMLHVCFAQTESINFYKKTSAMIPMRDGVKLFTVIFSPVAATHELPVLLQRTPYGANSSDSPDDTTIKTQSFGTNFGSMLKEGYFLVFQDIRGKYKSQGTMEIHQPLIHSRQKSAVDESTDTWDTVDWLMRNLKGNNGKEFLAFPTPVGWHWLVLLTHTRL